MNRVSLWPSTGKKLHKFNNSAFTLHCITVMPKELTHEEHIGIQYLAQGYFDMKNLCIQYIFHVQGMSIPSIQYIFS